MAEMVTPSPTGPPTGAIRLLELILLIIPVIGIMLQISLRHFNRDETNIHPRDSARGAFIVYATMYLLVLAAWSVVGYIKGRISGSALIDALEMIRWAVALIFAFVTLLLFSSRRDVSQVTLWEILLPVPLLKFLEKIPGLKKVISYQPKEPIQSKLDEGFHERED